MDWTAVLAGQDGTTVPLPTYAFQRRRYWLDLPEPVVRPAAPGATGDDVDARFWEAVEREDLEALADTLDLAPELRGTLGTGGAVLPMLAEWRKHRRESTLLDSWRYSVAWQPSEGPAANTGALPSHWLVVLPAADSTDGDGSDADPVTRDLVERLRGHQGVDEVVTFTVDVTGEEGTELADRLRNAFDRSPATSAVLNLLPLAPATATSNDGQDIAVPQVLGATFLLMRTLTDVKADVPLWTVTRGAVDVTGARTVQDPADEGPLPEQAAVWGLGRVYGLDHPQLWGGLIDLPTRAGLDGRSWNHVAVALAGADDEDQFAVRAEGLLVRRMVRKPAGPRPEARTDAVFGGFTGTTLITGGTGALGAHLARRLAATGAAHLLLVSRRGPEAPGATDLAAELTALGARVTVAACDITDRTQLAALLAAVPDDAPVGTVVHAAGVEPPSAAIGDTGLGDLRDVMSAKIAGAVHLDELLADRPEVAFVLFSSGAGVWGDGGHCGYAAANAYLDAFAERRRARGRAATSIAWGAWSGGGMVHAEESERLHRYGVITMDPEVAVGAVRQALELDEPSLVVAAVDWDRFAPTYSATRRRRLFDGIPETRRTESATPGADADGTGGGGEQSAGPAAAFAQRLAGAGSAERERTVLHLIRTQVAAVLGHDGVTAIAPGQAFRDLGFDSLTAVELRNRLKEATGLGLPATLVFDHPTPAALGERLLAELAPDTAPVDQGDLASLDALEATVAALDPGDDSARTRITTRLQALLWRLSDHPADVAAPEDGTLGAASDDEMFDLINKELGLG
ncbi:SDR family NAD(P)-dependent oxidoreductase [Streptomyces corynorhini]|uniref:SDR family NAD(P)-dependent oxidoreductase n=1 Tax=Streptomyces corynorhini TaxID=2282652 RepID=A0A370AU68_9ACTN|nr:SDR family NAD(P)-dependent oxidoreductase [Streptomyces corynorhini]